jgi:hypothetical protein
VLFVAHYATHTILCSPFLAPNAHRKPRRCSPPVLRLAADLATPLARGRSVPLSVLYISYVSAFCRPRHSRLRGPGASGGVLRGPCVCGGGGQGAVAGYGLWLAYLYRGTSTRAPGRRREGAGVQCDPVCSTKALAPFHAVMTALFFSGVVELAVEGLAPVLIVELLHDFHRLCDSDCK